jgi:hypothetical protein
VGENVGAPTFTEWVDKSNVLLEGWGLVGDPSPRGVRVSAGIIGVTGEWTVSVGIIRLSRGCVPFAKNALGKSAGMVGFNRSGEWRVARKPVQPSPLPLFFGTRWKVIEGKGDRVKTDRYGNRYALGSARKSGS